MASVGAFKGSWLRIGGELLYDNDRGDNQIFLYKKNPERYQNLVLWAWLTFTLTP